MNSPDSSEVRQSYRVTVVIPTYKRADILPHMISALQHQTYKNFDTVFVVKPSGDGTEEIINHASPTLKVTTVEQTKGHIVDAYFLGVKASSGDIVAFLDDDAIPADNWLEETIKVFQKNSGVAVTGDAFPVYLKTDGMQIIEETEVPSVQLPAEFALFGRPLKGLEDYKNCIADSGIVYERGNNAYWRKRGTTKALLRGPSMAIPGEVLRSIEFPGDWILGCGWEMVLGWMLWKRGITMLYAPSVRVFHVVHGRTSSRDFLNPRADLLWVVEAEMLFYRLYRDEPQLSVMRKIEADIMRSLYSLKSLRFNRRYHLRKIEGICFGNIVGAKWMLYKLLNVPYSPLADLSRFKPKQSPN